VSKTAFYGAMPIRYDPNRISNHAGRRISLPADIEHGMSNFELKFEDPIFNTEDPIFM
jgi:hypothetical protein